MPDLGYHSKPTGVHPSVARGGVNGRSARGTPPVRNARKEATHRNSDRKRPDRPGLDSRRTSLVKSDKPSGDDRKPSARPTVAQDFQRKVDLIKRFVGKAKTNPSAAAMELSKIENITNELCDLDDDPDADLSEVVVSSSDLTGHDGDVSDTEAENEVHAALTEALKHTEADDDSALEYADNIMDQWRSLGLLNLEIELDIHQDELLILDNGLRMAYVDTCGSKCYVRDESLCINGTVRPLKSPIKVVMGKGHSTASKIGIMNFHLKAIHYVVAGEEKFDKALASTLCANG